MFKKIEIWILYLIVLLGIPLTIGFGFLVRQELVGSAKFGGFSKIALFLSEIPVQIKLIASGRNDGLSVDDRFPMLDGFTGIPNSNESYLLLSRYNGDISEGIVELIDLTNFKVLHTWNPDIDKFNKSVRKVGDFKYIERDHNNRRTLLEHPKLIAGGGLSFNSSPLRVIDGCSDLTFQNDDKYFHHSIETDIEGNTWVPSNIYPQTLPEKIVGRDVTDEGGTYEDGITKLSPSGEILFQRSLTQIFIDNHLENQLFGYGHHYMRDPLHLNDIQPVDFDGEYWKKGDVFLSLRNQSTIALYRPSTNKIIWNLKGPFFNQHDVDILDDHRISIFNNRMQKSYNEKLNVDGNNEVIIYNFKTGQYSLYLNDSLIKNDVRTKNGGLSEILPNGDLFIEESNYARTLYFNSDGSLRWTHVNRAGNGIVYRVGWSRILHTDKDIKITKNFLKSRGKCDE
ncbi:arylsulfotransferase family protein [Synechococcus sp. BOUM118]|nr:arylsulfotransferase family protein [Synechococcus sp. BOUM118]